MLADAASLLDYAQQLIKKEVYKLKSFFSIPGGRLGERGHLFRDSARELRSLSCITTTAMLLALNLALRSLVIPLGAYVRISFGFLAIACIGMLFGPVPAAMAAGLGDIIGFLFLNRTPGPYFPGYTLVAVLGGVFYGVFLYKRARLFPGILFAQLCTAVICNLLLNTWFLTITNGQGLMAILPLRVVKNLAQLPVNILLLVLVLEPARSLYRRMKKGI